MSSKVLKSVKWTTINAVISSILGPLIVIIKARFLNPDELGYLAIMFIVNGFFLVFVTHGIAQSVVKANKIDQSSLSTLQIFNILLGLVVTLIIILFAGLIERLYNMPRLAIFVQFFAFQVFLTSFGGAYKGYLMRIMDFKHLTIVEIVTNVVVLSSQYTFFLLGYKIEAIISATLISSGIRPVLFYIYYRKSGGVNLIFSFRYAELKSHIKFSGLYSGKLAVNFLNKNIDSVVIGYFLPESVLGVYYLAKKNMEQIRVIITNSLTSFLFPYFSEIKNDDQKLKSTYIKMLDVMAIISVFVCVLIFSTSSSFVPVLFGSQWIDSVIVFKVLSVSMFFSIITANLSTSMLYIKDKALLIFYFEILIGFFYLVLLLFFASYGLEFVLFLTVVSSAITSFFLHKYTNRSLGISRVEFSRLLISKSFFGAILIGINFMVERLLFNYFNHFQLLTILVLLSIILFYTYLRFFQREIIVTFKGIVKKRI